GGLEQMVNSLRAEAATRADAAGQEYRKALRRVGLEGNLRAVKVHTVAVLALRSLYSLPSQLLQLSEAAAKKWTSSDAVVVHLMRHGVKAEAVHTVSNDISEGDALLSYAADLGADLIVCGGYGHSRAREMVFGGVTRTLLQEMTVPMLLSH